jgi:hypothetical protein
LSAKIINHGLWVGYNEVLFKIAEPETVLRFKPHHGSKIKSLGIGLNKYGEYEIRTQ